MSADGKSRGVRSWRLLAAVASVLALGVGSGLLGRPHAPPSPAPVDLTAPAAAAIARVEEALAAQARALEPAVAAAARVPELTAALKMDADQATFQDLLDNEAWWQTYRAEFPLSAILADKPLAVVGPGAGRLAESKLVRACRQRRAVISGIMPGEGRAFVAAAAPAVPRQGSAAEIAPIVLLGKLVDESALRKIAEVTGDVVGLSDGARLIEAGGPGEPRRILGPLVGHERALPTLVGEGRLGSAAPLGGGNLFLLVASTGPAAAGPSPSSSPSPSPSPLGASLGLGLGLAGAGAAGLLGLALSARRRPRPLVSARSEAPTDASPRRPGQAFPQAPPSWPDSIARRRNSPLVPGPSEASPRESTLPMPNQAVQAAQPSPVHEPTPGNPLRLGRYELIERIGEGGMAEIFFAVARGAEDFVRHFVVKRMHPHLARSREAVNQFIDEARLQAGLVHSNIVPVFDFGKAGGEYFLALEYIHGRDLGQLVQLHVEKLGRPLDVPLAFFVVHDVLDALAYAHGQIAKDGRRLEIVHRDVSPGNVLVSYQGEIKLTDFGIAKAGKRISRTEAGMVKGNASFMSPEQARGEHVDQRSDIFCAGLVLFYCLTGQLLYRGETTLNRLMRAAVGPATSQFGQIDHLPLPAAKVLRRALAIEPDRRYASATEFARELSAAMATRSELGRIMDLLFPPPERRDLR